MFVDLIAPKNRWKRSTWQLEAIAAGVVCGSYCSTKSRSKASTWQLEAIAAGVVCGSYCSEEPLLSIDMAA